MVPSMFHYWFHPRSCTRRRCRFSLWFEVDPGGDAGPRLAQKLLGSGADPDAATADGETPLLLAAACGSAELLLEHGADPTPEGPRAAAAANLARLTGTIFVE